MKRRSYIAAGCLGLLCGACEQDFNPKGIFLDRVVVFGVLSQNQTTHFVRLSSTYDPPGFNPLEHTSSNQISNAVVTIQVDTTTIAFRDTTLSRNDVSRYQDSISAFVASPHTITRGKTYSLAVSVPGYGTMTATTVTPGIGIVEVDFNTRYSLTNPDVGMEDIVLFATPSATTEGYLVKVLVEYEVVSQNPGVLLHEEVPSLTANYQDCLTYDAVYPDIRRRRGFSNREAWIIPYLGYRRTILKILKTHDGEMIDFHRVIIVMVQADRHFYSYYSLVGGFRDEFTIRVDEPNYSNIEGGLGMFGSYSADSLFSINLPQDFPKIACP